MTLADRLLRFSRAVAARYPPLGELIRVGGRRVHVLAAGPAGAPAVVLLHGASGNLRDRTLSVFDRLAERHRVVAVDRPGFGHSDPAPAPAWTLDSQVAVLRAALAARGHRRVVLVGHSYAGALALRWALSHPGEVAGILDLSGAVMDWGGDLGAHYGLASAPVLGALAARAAPLLAGRRTLAAGMAGIFAPNPVPQRYPAEGGVELALRPATFRLNARMMHRLHGQIVAQHHRYGAIACPIEIVHGTADRIVPARIHAGPLADAVPQARLTLLPGIGHMPHHAAPDAVVRAVERLAARATD